MFLFFSTYQALAVSENFKLDLHVPSELLLFLDRVEKKIIDATFC